MIIVFAVISILCVCISSCSSVFASEIENEVEIIEETEPVETETGTETVETETETEAGTETEIETGIEIEKSEIDYTGYMLQITKSQYENQLLLNDILEIQNCILFLMAFIFAWYIINRAFLMIRK